MILADKIIMLRKRNGWSQEELAEQLGVSRQSVSKWEGAQSMPDLNKIIVLSQIFEVSTDFLLKDEMNPEDMAGRNLEMVLETDGQEVNSVCLASSERKNDHKILGEKEIPLRKVSMEEANHFLSIVERTAKQIAFAAFLCIFSPIPLILFAGLAETNMVEMSEDMICGIGVVILLLIIAAATAIFISVGMKTKPFEYLEKEPIETAYGVTGMVKERQQAYKDTYARFNVLGVVLCILSVIPILITGTCTENEFYQIVSVCALLFLVGLGVFCLVTVGTKWGSMQKLLEEGDYSRAEKRSLKSAVSTAYWLIVTAIFLVCVFLNFDGRRESWVIWPIAGILYAVLMTGWSAFERRR